MSSTDPIREFSTPEQAIAWMLAHLDEQGEEYMDNERFAFLDDPAGMDRYDHLADAGCCGSFDTQVIVDGRPARVGCNHGH